MSPLVAVIVVDIGVLPVVIVVGGVVVSLLMLTSPLKLSLLLVVVLARLFSFLLFAEMKALMAYDEGTKESASESNEDQDQAAAAVAARKDESAGLH